MINMINMINIYNNLQYCHFRYSMHFQHIHSIINANIYDMISNHYFIFSFYKYFSFCHYIIMIFIVVDKHQMSLIKLIHVRCQESIYVLISINHRWLTKSKLNGMLQVISGMNIYNNVRPTLICYCLK